MRNAVDLGTVRRELDRRSTDDLMAVLRNSDAYEWRPEVFELVFDILEERGVSSGDVAAAVPQHVLRDSDLQPRLACPRCGSTKVTQKAEAPRLAYSSSRDLSRPLRRNACGGCGLRWPG
jgi:hypothetical protein